MNQEIRENILQLMKKRDNIEDEIKHLTEILTLNGAGMNDPLVDAEGFPLNSVDVYQVRHVRHKIICLQNDYKAIMKEIENGLHGYYSINNTSNQTCGVPEIEMKNAIKEIQTIHQVPFAKVTFVGLGSPAESAGLHLHDLIVEFGSVNSTNFKNIIDIAQVVQHSEGSNVLLKVKRGEHFMNLQLIPRKWQGRGLLGCNIDTLK